MCAGHASSATLFSFYNTGYFIWSLYFRHRRSVMGQFVARRGWRGVFLKDMGQSLGFYWVLAQVRGPPCAPSRRQGCEASTAANPAGPCQNDHQSWYETSSGRQKLRNALEISQFIEPCTPLTSWRCMAILLICAS